MVAGRYGVITTKFCHYRNGTRRPVGYVPPSSLGRRLFLYKGPNVRNSGLFLSLSVVLVMNNFSRRLSDYASPGRHIGASPDTPFMPS